MRIKRMTATFGGLTEQRLELGTPCESIKR